MTVIVAGHLRVAPDHRDDVVRGSRGVVEQARRAPGCLDFDIWADSLDADRVNVYERWSDVASVEAFRQEGPAGEQSRPILAASISQYGVAVETTLT